jgi:hypothetical protein
VLINAFLGFNYRKWDSKQLVYGVMNGDDDENVERNKSKGLPLTFLYTTFVFFGLKIDFGKLNYSNKPNVVVFFIEYLTWLICMFFILNVILKIK